MRSIPTEQFLEFTGSGIAIVSVPIAVKSSQNGSVFSVSLARQTELLLLAADASRQLTPTGFVFLSRQDSYGLKANLHSYRSIGPLASTRTGSHYQTAAAEKRPHR